MGRIITIANEKGGVGKTTVVFDTAYRLSVLGNKVLMIDIDPQINLTLLSGADISSNKNIFSCINGISSFSETIISVRDNLDILPGSRKMQSQYFIGAEDIYILKEAVKYIYEYKNYDYIIIDVGPSPGTILTMSLLASDYYIAIALPTDFAYKGLAQMCADINIAKKCYNQLTSKPLGILINNITRRTNVSAVNLEAIKALSSEFGADIFETQITSTCKIEECKKFNMTIQEYFPKGASANDFIKYVDEIIKRINILERR